MTTSAPPGPVAPEDREGYQDGSRWIHRKPPGTEVAEWFKGNVKLHEGLEHADYVQGVTLIPQTEKVYDIRWEGDSLKSVEVDRIQVFTPYAKVETRIAYWWDYVRRHEGWLGVIEPGDVRRVSDESLRNDHLPAGFFQYPMKKNDGSWVQYLGCSMQASIYERDVRTGGRGRLVFQAPAGTKIVAVASKWAEDANVIMKAETGAVGRALGMAGMLVIPGSGVATAEDMQEALSAQPGAAADVPAALPADGGESASQAPQAADSGGEGSAPKQQSNAERAGAFIDTLQADHPEKFEEIKEWARGRNLNLGDLGSVDATRMRGLVRKLEKAIEEATAGPAKEPPDTSDPEA